MKRGKKLSALFLALVMAFSLAVPAGAANWDDDLTGHIVILHTNDVHGAIDNYASVAALKDAYEAAGAQVLLMDAGDFSQGSTSVNVSEGATAVELMNMAGYDVATTGNHEFDFGYANLKTLMESADFPILAADAFTAEGDLAMDGDNLTFQLGDVTVGVFGLATPETATKAHPAKLEGVTFLAEDELFACAQEQVDELTAAGCDYIICLGHLGIDAESTGNRSIDLLENVTGIDVFIDGHSHSTQSDIAEETNGTGMVGDTILTSTGTKLESVGVVDIAADGTIDASTISMEELNATEGFTPDVIYVTLTGLMNGTGDGFSPNNNINRAQLVTVLYRMAGQPEVTGENPFTDVPDGQWYTDAVLWAAENGITDGTSETTFSPNDARTREQMATFLYRFANFEVGEPIEVTGDLSGYTDADLVADYAVDAMTWAVGEGVISGIGNNTLAPDNTASRAQMATVLTRYTAE